MNANSTSNFGAIIGGLALASLMTLPAKAQQGDRLSETLATTTQLSALRFTAAQTQSVPGKGRGTPAESAGDLGIALVFSQNNYWTDNRWSAAGYTVSKGLLVDLENRLPAVQAWEVSPPVRASDFQFFASGSDLFFRLPAGEERVVYSVIGVQEIGSISSGKRIFRFRDSILVEEALVRAADIVVGGFTRIPEMKLHNLTAKRVFCHFPATVVPAAETTVVPGMTAVRLSDSGPGRVNRLSLDVSAAGTPADSYRNQPGPGASYGRDNQFVCFAESDGGLAVCWQDGTTKSLLATSIGIDLGSSTVNLPAALPVFGSCARDPQGNWYSFSTATGTDPAMVLVKADRNGDELARRNLSATEFDVMSFEGDANGARLHYAAGRLCLVLARTMHSGHQGSIIVTFDHGTLATVRNFGQNSSHSFDSRVIHDGAQFLNLSLGDNYPRGIIVHKIRETSSSGRVVFTYKTQHGTVPKDNLAAGMWSNDNRTYTELGGLTALTEGYGMVISAEKSTDNALAVSSINEARNVGYLLLAPSFDTVSQQQYLVSPGMILSQGMDSPEFGFYDYGGSFRRQQYRGVKWLTNYTDKNLENASRSRIVAMSGSRQVVLWEKWTPAAQVSTHGMVIDAAGNVLEAAVDLGPARLSGGDSPVRSGDRIYSVTADGKKLEWTIIEPFWMPPKPFVITSFRRDSVTGRHTLSFQATTGRRYHLQESTTLADSDWHDVPDISLTASQPLESFVFDLLQSGPRHFFRVVEQQ